MDRDSIISDLFKSKDFNDCINKMEPRHLRDDLRSEVMLILCEKPAEVIEAIHKQGNLRFYAVRIILNLIQSKTSPFYKTYRSIKTSASGLFNLSSDGIDIYNEYGLDSLNAPNDKKAINSFFDNLTDKQEINLKQRLTEEKKNELRMMEVYNLYWYDQEMIRLYLENGNYRAIGAKTGISHVSIFNTIKKASHKIDDEVDLRMLRNQPYDFSELMEYISKAQYLEPLEYLNNVLDYYQSAYPTDVLAEVKRRAKEKEESLTMVKPQINIA